MRTLPVLLELPPAYLKAIGKIAHQYAYIEHVLQLIAFDLLNISPVQGRIAIRQPRPRETYEMICELANSIGITISNEFDTLGNALEQCQSERDRIAHGLWVKETDGTIFLRLTSGTWQPVKGMKGKEKRRIKPEGVAFGADQFMQVTELLVSTRDVALALLQQTKEATAAMRKKT